MTLDSLIQYCESLPAAQAIIKIDHPTYNIGGKAFIWFGHDEPIACSFKCTDEDFASLCERDGFAPAPYMARNKWIARTDIALLSRQDVASYFDKSYALIRAKLPKKLRDTLL